MSTLDRSGGAPRHLVLIDFDWEDADLLPELLRMPGVSVRLVAGAGEEDAGVRIAELCGLPLSIDPADLARDIFDVALVGERSGRREQVERLLRALGTPVESPSQFVRGAAVARREPAEDAGHGEAQPATLVCAAPEPSAAAASTATAYPTAAADARGATARGVSAAHASPADEPRPAPLPGPDDAPGLERALAAWARETQASAAALFFADGERLTRVCGSGPEDPLLESLAQLVSRLDVPHVLTREDGPQQGRLWGAWPFGTAPRRAVLSVGAAEGARGRQVWEAAVHALGAAWCRTDDTIGARPAGPNLLPWDAFAHRLQAIVDRHHADGLRFALHRLVFGRHERELDELMRGLPDRLRSTDCLCRRSAHELLLLCTGSPHASECIGHRIRALWAAAWTAAGRAGPAPEILDERLDAGETLV